MPELPEVETIVRGLRGAINNLPITKVQRSALALRRHSSIAELESLCGERIIEITRRAKYIIMTISNGKQLLLHLGMSGRLLFFNSTQSNHNDVQKHQHLSLSFANGSQLVLYDPRRFGMYELCDIEQIQQHQSLRVLGIEPFTDGFNGEYLHTKLRKHSGNIKGAIMNGKIVVGVGNIYASESLFMSKIHPMMPACNLNQEIATSLVSSIKTVLEKAIAAGGSTLRDYVQADGNIGNFQNNFLVYARQGQNCQSCGTKILRLVQNGRSTFFCPQCQASSLIL